MLSCGFYRSSREKFNKYQDIAREQKTLWNMMVTVIPIVVGGLGTVLKNLEKRLGKLEIKGRIKGIQILALKNQHKSLEDIWRSKKTCCHFDLREKHQLELIWKNPKAENETNNHIMSECSKLAQKEYKTKQDWEGKVILWDCPRDLNLTILPNGTCTNQNPFKRMHDILWDFEIQTDHLNTIGKPNRILINKRKKLFVIW